MSPSFKFPSPESFDGKPDSQGGSKAREFFAKCEIYFSFYDDQFKTDVNRSRFILFLCKDAAYAWASAYMAALGDTHHELYGVVTSNTKFKDAFLAQFSSIDIVETATQELSRLSQTGRVSEFASRYRELASQTKWNDESKIAMFYSKLQDRIKDVIVASPVIPSKYEEYVNWAIKIGERLESRQSERPRGFTNNRPNRNRRTYPTNGGGQSSASANSQRVNLSQEELEKYRKENRCFKCGQIGHRSNDPKFHPRSQGGNRASNPGGPAGLLPQTGNAAYRYDESEEQNDSLQLDAVHTRNTQGVFPWREFEDVVIPSYQKASSQAKN